MKTISFYKVQEQLSQIVAQRGTLQKAAETIGISVSYLCDILHGNRQPGPKVLQHLGLEKVVSVAYVKERGCKEQRQETTKP